MGHPSPLRVTPGSVLWVVVVCALAGIGAGDTNGIVKLGVRNEKPPTDA